MPARSPVMRAAVVRAANAVRCGTAEEAVTARRDLAALRLEHRIRQIVDSAPPLTAEQAARLRALLPVPAREGGDDAT
jgi:hypothetical protein